MRALQCRKRLVASTPGRRTTSRRCGDSSPQAYRETWLRLDRRLRRRATRRLSRDPPDIRRRLRALRRSRRSLVQIQSPRPWRDTTERPHPHRVRPLCRRKLSQYHDRVAQWARLGDSGQPSNGHPEYSSAINPSPSRTNHSLDSRLRMRVISPSKAPTKASPSARAKRWRGVVSPQLAPVASLSRMKNAMEPTFRAHARRIRAPLVTSTREFEPTRFLQCPCYT